MGQPNGDDSFSSLPRGGNLNAKAMILRLAVEKEPGTARLIRYRANSLRSTAW